MGFIKVIILTQLVPIYIFDAHEFLLARPSTFNIIHAQLIGLMCWYAVATLSYLFLLYMNFSGYMDIIIGIGKLFYFDLPENFNRPFAANNFLEFWSRWHITLSTWFKNYIFYPFLKYMLKQWNKPKFSLYFGIIAYFITFFIIGLWHATTIQFIICGTLFGLGTSINKAYQAIMVKIYGKNKYHQYQKNLLYHYLSRGLTIAYFALALTCFWLKTNQFNAFFNGRFFLTIFIDIILLTFLLASAFFIWDLLMEKTTDIKLVLIRSSCLQYIALGIGIFLLTGAMVNAIYTAPTFIYKTF